jgi:hypothetical protein
MTYYRFTEDDLFTNTIEAYPDLNYFIYSGSIYINNVTPISGTHSATSLGVPLGNISLYEYNVNRAADARIYPFITKDANKTTFKTINKTTWNTQYNYDGSVITSSYCMSASINRYYITTNTGDDFSRLRALRNTIDHYSYLSPHYDYTSYYSDPTVEPVNMITIPSIFYGSSIRKGSVNLKWYVSGTLAAQASDYRYNGELVQVSGSTTGSVVGTVLYNEGVVLLTGSTSLGAASIGNLVDNSTAGTPKWIYFGRGANDGLTVASSTLSASFDLSFQGTSHINTLTMLSKAPKYQLNHSNNPTYLKNTGTNIGLVASSSYEYVETPRQVANVVSSSFTDVAPDFAKETYISKIGIYDDHKNLIGVAKLATPIRKTDEREFLFKLKLDI